MNDKNYVYGVNHLRRLTKRSQLLSLSVEMVCVYLVSFSYIIIKINGLIIECFKIIEMRTKSVGL